MNFKQMLWSRTLYTVEEFDVVSGCKHGSFEINKEQGEFYEDIPRNKWVNVEDLGDWAFTYLMEKHPYAMKHRLEHSPDYCDWGQWELLRQIAVNCLGQKETERRLNELKKVK